MISAIQFNDRNLQWIRQRSSHWWSSEELLSDCSDGKYEVIAEELELRYEKIRAVFGCVTLNRRKNCCPRFCNNGFPSNFGAENETVGDERFRILHWICLVFTLNINWVIGNVGSVLWTDSKADIILLSGKLLSLKFLEDGPSSSMSWVRGVLFYC